MSARRTRPLVLVVDDSVTQAQKTVQALEAAGFRTQIARNGREGLDLAAYWRPDVILSDILMPVMDGFALCREVRRHPDLKHVPVVLYTITYVDPKDAEFARGIGATRFMVKSGGPEALVHELRSALAEGHAAGDDVPTSSGDEAAFVGAYSERLAAKLEQKIASLEESNRHLEQLYWQAVATRDQLAVLLKTVEIAVSSLDRATVLDRLAIHLVTALRITACHICLLDEGGTELVVAAARAIRDLDQGVLLGRRVPLADLPVHRAVLAGREPHIVALDDPDSPMSSAERAARGLDGLSTVLLTPMWMGERPIGLISLAEARSRERAPISEAQVELAQAVAEEITLAIEHARAISEREQAEQTLREREEQLRMALNAGRMGVWEWRIHTGEVLWSATVEAIHGHAPGTFGGTLEAYVDDILLEDRERVRKAISRAVEQGAGLNNEYRIRRPDGTVRWVHGRGSILHDSQGKAARMIGVCIDITERKQAEEALHDSNRELEHALAELEAMHPRLVQQERLRALGEMASGIAHDFNNALSPIVGFSELLLTRPSDLANPVTARGYIELMSTAAQDAARVVSRLRDFSRPRGEGEVLMPVDINALVDHTIALTQPKWKNQALAAGATIDIHTVLEEIPGTLGDESELRELLTNLVFNAVDAMPQGGSITLRTHRDGKHVALEVCDTGLGMPAEVARRCFEPFFSTKGAHGTGLGLAMVYGIVQRHAGQIEVESEPGKGTTFRIRLPALTASQAEAVGSSSDVPSRPLRVLVVDDEPLVRRVIEAYLMNDLHAAVTAASGQEGLENFRTEPFDLVITDHGMPDMSGDELAAAIKELSPQTPIVLLTGYGDLMAATDEGLRGVDVTVSKPVTLAALRDAMARALAEEAGGS